MRETTGRDIREMAKVCGYLRKARLSLIKIQWQDDSKRTHQCKKIVDAVWRETRALLGEMSVKEHSSRD